MSTFLLELPLVFVSGALASAHCIGMCGAISATMNFGTTSVSGALRRQLIWSFGRIFTYAFLGLLSGFAGNQLTRTTFVTSQAGLINLQAAFAILAGLLLIVQGAISAGWFHRRVTGSSNCMAASVFGKFLQGGSSTGVFIAGIATGFLPCGLVYSFVALAAASASIWKGPLLMTAFGLGTVPVMLITGTGFSMASLQLRQRLMKLAAVAVVVTGLLTTGRGIAFAMTSRAASSDEIAPAERCPFCTDTKAIVK